MGVITRFGQLRTAFGLALSPSYSKLCFAVYVLVAVVFLEVCYLISLVVQQARRAQAADAPSLQELDAADHSASSLSRVPAACCVTGPPDEVVACVECPSPLPRPWLVWRKPPSAGRSSDTTASMAQRATALWDYSELLISAQGASKCPETRLVVAVRTEAQRRAQRGAIRRTWGHHGNYANCSFGLVFFMGAAATNAVVRPIRAEFQLHKDIVVELKGRREPPKTCTFVLATEWVPCFVPNASLTLVVSDDTFVDVKAILSALDWFTQSSGDLFGRVAVGRDTSTLPQLEGCAVFAKPSALRRLQPAFADEPLSCDVEEALVTGPLSRKAQLNLVHVDNMEPCNHGDGESVVTPPTIRGGASSLRPFTRTRVSISEMEKLYLQDLLYYHNFSSLM
ncbi:N-acetyllactosaminide beta-1,3-N-acetylglucosaminyltransferase 4-like isoform X1 [Dermacentor albipictus]|uniref:N-acetyllactosaminide beta-1,3-N-acetylglucosaminyltransferase 4-like isoform X1 n=1 Tax=Dermacentor albipictus TaxID=60249 RepID=UPI0031FBC449